MFQRESQKKAIDRSKVQKESFGGQNMKIVGILIGDN
jgi:hypothetical protein